MSSGEPVASTPEPTFRPKLLASQAGRIRMLQAADDLRPEPAPVAQLVNVALRAFATDRETVAAELLDRGRAALQRLPGSSARTAALARLNSALLVAELNAGQVPGGWFEAATRVLALADADADGTWAPDLVGDASLIAFHRTVQLDAAMTPLADDPAGFLQPFRESRAIRHGLASSQARGPVAEPLAGCDVVFVTEGNTHFLQPVVRQMETRGWSHSHVNLAERRQDFGWRVRDFVATVVGGGTARWDLPMRALTGSASLVWAEWAQRQVVIPSHALPAGPRLVVRLHAYEIFTALPQYARWDRVDDLVVVSPQMRNAVRAILPLPESLRVRVCGNQVDPDRYEAARAGEARFTLALVGHNSQVKDPAFALAVFDMVHRREPRARLLLIGDEMTPTHRAQGPGATAYANAYLDQVSDYVERGLVRVTGHVPDVAEALRSAGFVLSTSRRESFHLGLLEGALGGCVPVVRNWPIMAPFGGPRTFLPDRWVADDAAGMAERVLRYMGDESGWNAERLRCRDEARAIAAAGDAGLADLLAGTSAG